MTSLSELPLLCPIGFGLLWVHFHLFPETFISTLILFLTPSMFNSMLFNLHEFQCFWVLSLRLVSSFRSMLCEKMFDMNSIFFNLLRLVLCPIMWSIFGNVPCAFEKNVYFASWGWKSLSLYIYIYQLSPFALGHCSMPQYPRWLEDLSIFDSGMLKSPI